MWSNQCTDKKVNRETTSCSDELQRTVIAVRCSDYWLLTSEWWLATARGKEPGGQLREIVFWWARYHPHSVEDTNLVDQCGPQNVHTDG